MDTLIRGAVPSRSQWLFGLQAQLTHPRRPRPDERVDVPEIQESTRVSFSQGAAVQGVAPARTATAFYRAVAEL